MSAIPPTEEPAPSDWDLMHRVAEEDEEALRVLVQRHQGLLMNFFARSNVESHAEDLVQETFIRLYRCRHRYQPTAKFTTFLHTLARNVLIDYVRKRGRWYRLLDAWTKAAPESDERSSGVAARRMDAERALATLNEEMRTVVVLIFYQGLAYQDAAEVLGIPAGTVKSRMFHALQQLRTFFDSSSGGPPP